MGYNVYVHNKPHTEEAKRKMRLARLGKPLKWGQLSHTDIVNRLLTTEATTRSIAEEYGCSDSTIKLILRKYTTREQRLEGKNRKQGDSIRGRVNPQLKKWRATHEPWVGRKHTEEAKRRQSIAHKGIKQSIATRIAQSARRQGIDVKDWQGFVSSVNELARRNGDYKLWRESVYERDNYTCQLCGKRGGILHPHHIKPFAIFPELRYEVSNGITLCAEPCHQNTKGREYEYIDQFLEILGVGDKF